MCRFYKREKELRVGIQQNYHGNFDTGFEKEYRVELVTLFKIPYVTSFLIISYVIKAVSLSRISKNDLGERFFL